MTSASVPPHRPRKRFGQHFLRDASVIESIVAAIRPVLANGWWKSPRPGALTVPLLKAAGELDVWS